MVFSSLTFLFFFLPFTLLIYYICPTKWKNIILLIMSLIFYAWGEPVYIFLMIFSAVSDYIHGFFIAKFRPVEPNKAKWLLISSLIINISLLSFFKYCDFFINNVNAIFGTSINELQLPLPIGISFYTFQTMSYIIDVYRGQVQPQRSPIALAMYVVLFPQLIAGPIVRYSHIDHELNCRKQTLTLFADGVLLFIIGLGKKVLIANNIGLLWENMSSQNPAELTVFAAWLGIVAFAFQIYFDFSGYSDMAIGLGKMFGFTFPKNFDYPYMSKNISEFWRRWHMTLGGWFRDYVYIPLGGSKRGKARLYINLFIVWFLTGFWHGASWNFIFWGLYFGVIIAVEKAGLLTQLNKLHPVWQRLYFIFLILIGWLLFAFENLSAGILYAKSMFGILNNRLFDQQFFYDLYTNIVLLVVCVIASTSLLKNSYEKISKNRQLIKLLYVGYLTLIIIFSTAYLVDNSFNPFLYFRF
ncbi:MBOAT family protein [Bacillus sp. AGMB 02131]|uniref:MBOAT family protein n=1 Tax=Peribacillus faecalis TaxID=2772559 RepID=A0A927CVA8_9BACI|nr:MBOAT family protein [Peribacillus faecalis]MBD3108467.1 MBOAT family protein [Peribacillus faecalis]